MRRTGVVVVTLWALVVCVCPTACTLESWVWAGALASSSVAHNPAVALAIAVHRRALLRQGPVVVDSVGAGRMWYDAIADRVRAFVRSTTKEAARNS